MKPSGRGTRAAFFLFATMLTVFSLACGGLSPSSAAESDAAAHNRSARGGVGHGYPNLGLLPMAKPSALAKMARSIW